MITVTCDRCDGVIDERLGSYESLIAVSGGYTGLHNLIYGGDGLKGAVTFVGHYCKDCSNELPVYNLRREIKKTKENKPNCSNCHDRDIKCLECI